MFIHGLESSNQGTKSLFFNQRYPDMMIPNFSGTLPERMEKLEAILSGKSGIIWIGSSFGGLMAALFAMEHESRVNKLILLAPALNFMAFTSREEREISVPVWIYHGERDEVIPMKDVEDVAQKCFQNLFFHKVDDDHFLHKTFKAMDWDGLLS